jgi:hypothetical protein
MTYLAGLYVTGVKGIFMLIGWTPAGSLSYWLTAERGRGWKNPVSSPALELSCWRVGRFFYSTQVAPNNVPSCDIAPLFQVSNVSRSRTNYFKLFIYLLCVA